MSVRNLKGEMGTSMEEKADLDCQTEEVRGQPLSRHQRKDCSGEEIAEDSMYICRITTIG